MEVGLNARIAQEKWRNATSVAGNLSELHLVIGHVKQALRYAELGVELSDRCEDAYTHGPKASRRRRCPAPGGAYRRGRTALREAEEMQKEFSPSSRSSTPPGLPILRPPAGPR